MMSVVTGLLVVLVVQVVIDSVQISTLLGGIRKTRLTFFFTFLSLFFVLERVSIVLDFCFSVLSAGILGFRDWLLDEAGYDLLVKLRMTMMGR